MTAPVLRVEDLSVAFHTRDGVVRALDKVGFTIAPGETMALVGESGSGKSVTAYAIMGLLEAAGKVTGGRALLGETDLIAAPAREMADIRGARISMIFQNPRAALNPIRQVGKQIADVLLPPFEMAVRDGGARFIERACGVWANGHWSDFDPVAPPRVVALDRRP